MDKLDSKKVAKFLMGCTVLEVKYAKSCLDFAQAIRDTIFEFGLTKKQFCIEMGIGAAMYERYIRGAVNFDAMAIARLESLRFKLYKEKKDKEAAEQASVVKFPDYKYSEPLNQPS